MIHGEWREPADLNPSRLALVLVLVAAALLRFWAISSGVPFQVQVDEPEVMERAVMMMKTADFNPHFFDYPSFYIYVQAVVAVFRFVLGAMQGRWSSLAAASTWDFYVWGRSVTAMLGTATVWIVYRAGMRWGGRTALLAAAMLAVMPLHVRESHYVLTDVPVTFFVALTFLLSLRAYERATMWSFIFAAMAAGLAGATKYNGILAVGIPLLACAMTPAVRPTRRVRVVCIVCVTLVTFLVASPYTLMDLPAFLNGFARLSSEYRRPSLIAEPIWLVYLKHLRIALQSPGSLIVMAGLTIGAWRVMRGPNRTRWALAISFPLIYFWFISRQAIVYARYLLPLVPFLSLLGAAAIVFTIAWMRRTSVARPLRDIATIFLTVVAIGPPAYTAIQFDANAAEVWTTQLAFEWIRRELPHGARIQSETRAFLIPPEFKATYVKELRLARIDPYAATDIDFLVSSSQNYGNYFQEPDRYRAEYAEYQQIFAQTEEVARFTPSSEHPGPTIRILKVNR
jgi:4-amino-4-deoxy-L-arabinose transferase-like glycosyltransferase